MKLIHIQGQFLSFLDTYSSRKLYFSENSLCDVMSHTGDSYLHMKQSQQIIVLFVETPRKFITAKLSIRKPGSSSVPVIICTDEDPGLRIESFAVINLRGVSINKTIICFIAMQTYKELTKVNKVEYLEKGVSYQNYIKESIKSF